MELPQLRPEGTSQCQDVPESIIASQPTSSTAYCQLDGGLECTPGDSTIHPVPGSSWHPPTHTDATSGDTAINEVHISAIGEPGAYPQPQVRPVTPQGHELHGRLLTDACKAESSSIDAADTCVICYEGLADRVMLPCGHAGYCAACARRLFLQHPMLCPICRVPLEGVVKVSSDIPIGGMQTYAAGS